MTCGLLYLLWVQTYESYWYFMKKNIFNGYFENLGPIYEPYAYNFKNTNSKHKNIGSTSILPCQHFQIWFHTMS
jgi:hypothetical protein